MPQKGKRSVQKPCGQIKEAMLALTWPAATLQYSMSLLGPNDYSMAKRGVLLQLAASGTQRHSASSDPSLVRGQRSSAPVMLFKIWQLKAMMCASSRHLGFFLALQMLALAHAQISFFCRDGGRDCLKTQNLFRVCFVSSCCWATSASRPLSCRS